MRQQWLQMEGGCPESIGGVLWTTGPGEREGMQYVGTFLILQTIASCVLTLVWLLSSVTDVLSVPGYSFPSNPSSCLLELWCKVCLCSVAV